MNESGVFEDTMANKSAWLRSYAGAGTGFFFSINAAIVIIDVIGLVLNLPAVIWLVKHVNKTPMFYVLRAAGITDVLMLAGQLACSLVGIVLLFCDCARENRMLDIIGVSFILRDIHQCNIWLTVLMSLERYVAICRPYLHTKLFTKKLLILETVIIVLVSTAYSSRSLALLCTGDTDLTPANSTASSNCTFLEDSTGMLFLSFGWYERSHAVLAIIDHVLAMVLLSTSYICILIELQRASRRWFELTLLKRTECSSSHMPTCIITIFFLFESPKVVIDVICITGLVEVDHSVLYKDITTLLLQLCTATNVFVYFVFSQSIRKRVLQLCGVSETRLEHVKLFRRSYSQINRPDIHTSHVVKPAIHAETQSQTQTQTQKQTQAAETQMLAHSLSAATGDQHYTVAFVRPNGHCPE